MTKRSIWIGFDPRETAAFAVCEYSIRAHLSLPIPIRGVVLSHLREQGLYTRPTSIRDGRLWDEISEAPMATEFAVSRFLVPHLVKTRGSALAGNRWAVFMDCDMLVRDCMDHLFDRADSSKAVMVVKHDYTPKGETKMDGQAQTAYARKNWSSVMLFNCDHPANRALTPELVNTVPGRDLHRFCWLKDKEIGELSPKWNWLVGYSDPKIRPSIVHFTDGCPFMQGYENVDYADEWRSELARWAA